MLELFYKYPRVLNRLRSGPLGGEMDGIAVHLSRVGYTRGSSRSYLAQIARFSRFAASVGHEVPGSIDRDVAERFLLEIESPTAQAIARTAIGHAFRHIQGCFSWVRGPESSQDPASPLLVAFDEYLRDVRTSSPLPRPGGKKR